MNRAAFLIGFLVIPLTILWFLDAGDAPKTGPATEKRFPPLKVPPGFKATLFACDPLIEYPSVISIGPKPGAIFVAVDYMTGLGSDGKVKSEIRLVEDTDGDGYADKATVVAKGFNSIQGLAYHDDTLFVMHAPFLTSLRYDKKTGVTEQRKDLLTGLGLKPEDNSSRLHCANGVVVGHDGWLYLALGDNGVKVPRPEGDTLIHNGGGILRCKPGGRDLHIFSTGLRNIYDIALDADLNVFTRDNENDGGTYMIRVCHSFFGADHGYPYHYEERKSEAMPPIGDFGLGSSAGGVCYLEKQFPPEYRGNLFFCEWGKSVVRYELKRTGSAFAPVKELEFAVGDSKDTYPFKPTDVVVQRDGTMMVADYADGQRPKRGRGRIYHIKHVGKDADPVKKQPQSDLDKLNSESYFERWEAQRAFEGRGDAGRQELGDAFRANKIGPRAMIHALLALSKGGGGTGLGDMLALVNDPDPAIRLPAIRIIADLADPVLAKHKLEAGRGDAAIARLLAKLNKRDDPRVLLEITIALGRLRWDDAPAWLAKNLTKPDPALAHAAMQTLRRSDNWPAVLNLLDLADEAPLRPIALRAVAERHEPAVVDGLIARLGDEKSAKRRQEYADALTRVYKKPGAWKYWGYRPGPKPANTQAWEKTEAIAQSLAKLLMDADVSVRSAVLKQMQREKVPVTATALSAWLNQEKDAERAAMLIGALGADASSEARRALYVVGVNGKTIAANRLLALDLYFKGSGGDLRKDLLNAAADLSVDHGPVLAGVLRRLGQQPNFAQPIFFVKMAQSKDAEVRAAAVEALGALRLKEGREPTLQLLGDADVRVRRAAASAAGHLGVKDAVEPLLKSIADADAELRLASLQALTALAESRAVPFAVKALDDAAMGPSALVCLSQLGGPEHARAVVDYVKRSPTADNLTVAVRGLNSWSANGKREELDRAIAELHGSIGILARWQVHGPAALDKIVTPETKLPWTTFIADGAEGRLTLAPKADVKQPSWWAYADVQVPKETPIEFSGSSRGAFQVWLNAKAIHQRKQTGAYKIDSDRFTGVLEAGANRILVQTSDAAGPIEFHLRFRRKSSKAAHEKLTQAALSRNGNPERGRKIFFDKDKSQCIKCHQLGTQGERIGPELTGVGGRFSRIYLVESILEPSRTIAPSFGTLVVTLKNGKQLNGVKLAENETTLTLADNQGQKHVLAKAEIDEQSVSAVSTMPEGLELRMSEDEFVDLIAFLANQKEIR